MHDAPLSTITIIQSELDIDKAIIAVGDAAKAGGFFIDDEKNLIFAAYDETDETNKKTRLSTTNQTNVFSYNDSPIATYTFPNAAQLGDGSYADVVVKYNALYLVPAKLSYVNYYGNGAKPEYQCFQKFQKSNEFG